MPTDNQPRSRSWNTALDLLLLVVGLLTLGFVGYVLYEDVSFEQSLYQGRIASLGTSSDSAASAAVLAYLRAYHFAVTKLVALLLGYAVITLGLLYVLRTAKSDFIASIQASGNFGVLLHTASPGLIVVALGTVLVVVALLVRSEVVLTVPDSRSIVDTPPKQLERAGDESRVPLKPDPNLTVPRKPRPTSGESAASASRSIFVRITPRSQTIDRTELSRSLENHNLGRPGNCKMIVIAAVGVTGGSQEEALARQSRLQEDVQRELIAKGACRDFISVQSQGEERPQVSGEEQGVRIEILDLPR